MPIEPTITTLAETAQEHTQTPVWAIVIGIVSVLTSAASGVIVWLNSRANKGEDRNEKLRERLSEKSEQIVLTEVRMIGMRMDSALAEMKATLTSIQASVTRHDGDIDELHRKVNALVERLVAVEASLQRIASKGGQHG